MKYFFRKPNSKQIQGLDELCQKIKQESNIGTVLFMVEVGSAYGEGAEIFVNYFGGVHCVDPWAGSTEDREKFFDERFKDNKEVVKLKGISSDFIDDYEDGSLDFVYIDANHKYKYVKEDIKMWLPKIKKGGFIGGHDYNYKFSGVIRAVHEEFDRPDWVFMDSSWLKQI